MKNILLILMVLLLIQCNKTEKPLNYLSFDSDSLLYTGRINITDSASILYWQGSSIKLNFTGTDLKVLLKDEKGKNYYNIILDKDSILILHPDSAQKKYYTLVSGLPNKNHSVEIFKRTEWTEGASIFYAFETNKNGKFLASNKKSEKTIEFYGNSITAGYAIHDSINDSPEGLFTDNYATYAAITARHFKANYYNTSRSGIGITVSWFPMIMPELYDRLNPTDSTSKWDFSKIQPDLVIINLFQNDRTICTMPDYPEFKARFGTQKPDDKFFIEKYKEFVQKIRKVYPDANIICALGPMSAVKDKEPWRNYIIQAVDQMNDSKIYTMFFPPIESDKHPKEKDHKKMAEFLIKFIEENKLL